MTDRSLKVAVVQRAPVSLDREATLEVAISAVFEVAREGARMVVFPETFIPGYPFWIWGLRPGDDYAASSELHARLLANSVDLSGVDLQPLRDAAAANGVVVVCGIHEREGQYSRGTLYNTLVTIGSDGTVLNRHRKLVPTNPERMVWGQGDASGLKVVETEFGRLGGLICWENYMPLARYALYAEGVEIYIASTWDQGDAWLSSMRHIASEGRCWVIASGSALHTSDIPQTFPQRAELISEERWINAGDSAVVSPGGNIISGPLHEEYGILYADINPVESRDQHRTLDVAGHYARPDIFNLTVDRSLRPPVHYL